MTTIEREFRDIADSYKYDILRDKIVDYYLGTILPLHISEYPRFIQEDALLRAKNKANEEYDRIAREDLDKLAKLAQNAWLDEVDKLMKGDD